MEDNKKLYIIIGIIAIILFAVIVVIILTDGSESGEEKNNENALSTTTTSEKNTGNTINTSDDSEEIMNESFDYAKAAEEQMAEPQSGETIAVMHVKNFGDITFKFFEDKAPKAVENFVTHAKDGYYDGVTFHRVMEEFMIQGGDPQGDGTGGESIWGEGFDEEIDQSLVPYRGALCMASAGYGNSSLGSQFFIVQANADESRTSSMLTYGYPENLVTEYAKYGGYLSLYGQYTVFGQVINGMDVVDKIAKVEKEESTSGELSVPVEDIIIESIDIKEKE